MAFQVSPSVTVKETDLTTIVPSVATTIGGIAASYSWGPADEVIIVDTPKNYRSVFGDPYNWNAEDWFTGANFLNYGRNLLVVRVCASDAKNSGTPLSGYSYQYVPNDGTDVTSLAPNVIAKYPGALGNSLKFSIGANTVTAGSGWTYWKNFGRKPSSTDNLVALAGTTTNDQIHFIVVDEDGLFTGEPGTILEKFESVSLHPEAKSLNGESTFWKNVINTKSNYVKITGSVESHDVGNDDSGPGELFGLLDLGLSAAPSSGSYVYTWKGNVGHHGTSSLTGGGGEQAPSSRKITSNLDSGVGYDLFSDPENIDVSLILGGSISAVAQVSALKNLVEKRKDCIAFLSSPVGKNDIYKTDSAKADICVNFANNIVGSSSYVVIDSGYKKQTDPYNQVSRWIPLNGDVAGVCARTDYTFDPWFSPAGLNRGQIKNSEGLAFNPNLTYRDRIYPEGINPVVEIVGEGTVLFGDKTALNKPSAFDRINVRRLFIVLEKAITAASKFSLFEFNDSFTRQQFRSLVEPFLRDVKSRRGIFDFKVVCDESNNTPEKIDRNEFVADIYIKPTRSINYIKLNFIATRTGVNFSEVGA